MSQQQPPSAWDTPPELWRGFKSSSLSWQGKIVSIYIAPKPSASMMAVSAARAFADRGLEGDRFFRDSWNKSKRPDKAVTLIEEETLERAAAELGIEMFGEKTRRNIITRGVPLIELLDREFTIGDVVMRGLRLFEPCSHLVKVSKIPGIFDALEHCSGLKAAILTDGVIRVGDSISLRQPEQAGASHGF